MFNEIEIKGIFEKAYLEFSKKYNISCDLKFVDEKEFIDTAKLSNIIQDEMLNGIPILVGALIEHKKNKDIVLLNVDILNSLSAGDKLFVKALIMHEFYHVLFKSKVKKNILKEDIKSEERAKKAMKKDFPKLANYVV
jgi:hypothetical protein